MEAPTKLAELTVTAVEARADYSRREVPRGTAPLWLRLTAVALDCAILALPILVGTLIVYSLRDDNGGGEADRFVFGAFTVAIAVATYVWNFGYRQGRQGASAGKQWCGLVVRGRDGNALGVRPSLLIHRHRQVVRQVTAYDEGFTDSRPPATVRSIRIRRLAGLGTLLVLLGVVLLASIAVGARPLTFAEIGAAVMPPYDLVPPIPTSLFAACAFRGRFWDCAWALPSESPAR